MPNKQVGGLWPFTKSSEEMYSVYETEETGVSSGVLQYLFYTLTLIIVILILLTLIHFTIYPIFKWKPGDKGVIPLPGSNDETLFWKKNWNTTSSLPVLPDKDTPLKQQTENWSFLLDIQVDNPTSNTATPRVLFTRGGPPTSDVKTFAENDTILKLNSAFNCIVYLDRLTNDLYVSIQTRQTSTGSQDILLESCVIPNVPVGKSIRLGVMVGSHILEVYVNGYLVKSKAFSTSVAAIVGSCYPPDEEIFGSTARVQNLRLWNRPLTPAEFRAYGQADGFPRKEIPDSCVK